MAALAGHRVLNASRVFLSALIIQGDTEFSQFFVQIITNKFVKGVNYITVYK